MKVNEPALSVTSFKRDVSYLKRKQKILREPFGTNPLETKSSLQRFFSLKIRYKRVTM